MFVELRNFSCKIMNYLFNNQLTDRYKLLNNELFVQ